MNEDDLNSFELLVQSRLDYLQLHANFKSLIKNVNHDLASPLSYLENSLDILNSQLGHVTNEELNETVKVITNSTSKLKTDAHFLINSAKSELLTLEKEKTLADVINSSLYQLNIKSSTLSLYAILDEKLNTDFILTQYLMCFYLKLIKSHQGIYLKSISIEQEKHITKLNMYCDEKHLNSWNKLEQKFYVEQKNKTYKSVCFYLNAEAIIEKSPQPRIKLRFNPEL